MTDLDPRLIQKGMQLRNSSFFKDISPEVLVEIATKGEDLFLQPGEILMSEGDPGDGLFFLIDGKLDVMMGGKKVNSLTDGEVLGEIALLDSGLRTATIISAEPSSLLLFSSALFEEIMEEYPEVAKQVLKTLVGRIRGLTRYISSGEHGTIQ